MSIHSVNSDIFLCCHDIQTLKRSPDDSEAKNLLVRAANQVKPIMAKRKWRVLRLSEFYPNNPSLLGLNKNGGEEVLIRLRHPRDFTRFLSYESILGTLLHELCHNERGPHDALFYKLLDEITKECEQLMSNGITGATGKIVFPGKGHKLADNYWPSQIPKNAREAAAAAAEKRKNYSTLLPQKGIKLGGGSDGIYKIATPGEMASAAAERRAQDQVWCHTPENNNNGNNFPQKGQDKSNNSGNKVIIIDDNDQHNKSTPSKRTQVDQPQIHFWECPWCTFVNNQTSTSCSICDSVRPQQRQVQPTTDNTIDLLEWDCGNCTLINEPTAVSCAVCGSLKVKSG